MKLSDEERKLLVMSRNFWSDRIVRIENMEVDRKKELITESVTAVDLLNRILEETENDKN